MSGIPQVGVTKIRSVLLCFYTHVVHVFRRRRIVRLVILTAERVLKRPVPFALRRQTRLRSPLLLPLKIPATSETL